MNKKSNKKTVPTIQDRNVLLPFLWYSSQTNKVKTYTLKTTCARSIDTCISMHLTSNRVK